MEYIINRVYDHYEVLDNFGRFLFSADTINEVTEQLEQQNAA